MKLILLNLNDFRFGNISLSGSVVGLPPAKIPGFLLTTLGSLGTLCNVE